MDYEQMLKAARKELPEDIKKIERFTIPKAHGHVQGNKTIVSNLLEIAKTLRRNANHLIKYLNKELATKGELKNNQFAFNTRVPSEKINQRIEQYTKKYVICKECGKPDSSLEKVEKVTFLRCHACGAKYSLV